MQPSTPLTPYQANLQYLYDSLPVYHRIGPAAYKAGLGNIEALCAWLGHPQLKFKTIHVAGTNGKGSTSHMLAAILQSAGFRTGLYTSPHLYDFRERIRIDGFKIEESAFNTFVDSYKAANLGLDSSFFELTVAMAFQYFAQQDVDIAIIETGLGGRLDSTNIITPLVSCITNIGWDHMNLLGDSLQKIAAEKAGIIKPDVPVVVSERNPEIDHIFTDTASLLASPLTFAPDCWTITPTSGGRIKATEASTNLTLDLYPQLQGLYQHHNIKAALTVITQLRTKGWKIEDYQIKKGLEATGTLTGLQGRWQMIAQSPRLIIDGAHNKEGIVAALANLQTEKYDQLWCIVGFVQDKDLAALPQLFPPTAHYIFCKPNVERGRPAAEVQAAFSLAGIQNGQVIPDVNEAIAYAKAHCNPTDLILVAGSLFLLADIAIHQYAV